MKSYSDDLVAHYTDANFDEGPDQLATLNACTRGGWLDAVKPYSDGDDPGAIAIASPTKVLDAMCSGQDPTPKACR